MVKIRIFFDLILFFDLNVEFNRLDHVLRRKDSIKVLL